MTAPIAPRLCAALTAIAAGLLMTACGGSPDTGTGARQSRPALSAGSPATHEEIATLAKTYLSAFAARDWSAVCRTRSPEERADFARTAGSCERAFTLVLKSKPGADELLAHVHVGDIRIRGRVAGVDVVQRGQTEPATTLAAVRRGTRWYLKDLADAKTP